MSFENHCITLARKAYRMLNILFRCVKVRDVHILCKLFTTNVRPLLEYATPIWNPSFKKNVSLIEKVQKRFTKLVLKNSHDAYHIRLHNLSLMSLEKRREIFDLCPVFQCVNSLNSSPPLFSLIESNSRGSTLKLFKPFFKSTRSISASLSLQSYRKME